jgi:hypothetical protein
MRFTFIDLRDMRRRVNWTGLVAFSVTTYMVVIGAAEVFWLLFAGGFSRLIAGLAAVLATLIVVRAVGEAISLQGRNLRSWPHRS